MTSMTMFTQSQNRYLYSCFENQVISLVRKHYCSLGLELFRIRVGFCENMFSVEHNFEQV